MNQDLCVFRIRMTYVIPDLDQSLKIVKKKRILNQVEHFSTFFKEVFEFWTTVRVHLQFTETNCFTDEYFE